MFVWVCVWTLAFLMKLFFKSSTIFLLTHIWHVWCGNITNTFLFLNKLYACVYVSPSYSHKSSLHILNSNVMGHLLPVVAHHTDVQLIAGSPLATLFAGGGPPVVHQWPSVANPTLRVPPARNGGLPVAILPLIATGGPLEWFCLGYSLQCSTNWLIHFILFLSLENIFTNGYNSCTLTVVCLINITL